MNTNGLTPVRETTREAWDKLQDAGETPSVRQIYEQVGGSYNVVAAECRTLRDGEQLLATAPEASDTWYPPSVRQAFSALCEAIQEDDKTYRLYLIIAKRLQGSSRGLLVDIIEAMRRG